MTQLLVGEDGEAAALHDLGGDGPSVLLTHGNGLNVGMWATVTPHLRSRFHCWGLDFRGHGASPAHDRSPPVARRLFVAEVLAAVNVIGEQTGEERIVAAGHSLGGATLLNTEYSHPGTFEGLWLFEPVVIPSSWEAPAGPSMLIEASRRRRMDFESVEAALARFTSKPPFSRCEPAAVRAYLEVGTYPSGDGVRLSCSGETEARIYESNERREFSEFASVSCPIVVAAGADVAAGNDLPPKVAPLIAEALGNARFEVLGGLTHFAPMENGALVAASIIAALSD